MAYIDAGRERGRRAARGRRGGAADSGGYFVAPTLFSATSDELRIAREEIFGPVLVASPYDTLEEVAAPRQRRASTASPPACGRATSASAHRLAAMLRAGWSTSTPGGWSIRRRRSAASRPRASAASTATTASTPTWRPRRSGPRCEPARRRETCGVSAAARGRTRAALRTRSEQWVPVLGRRAALLLLRRGHRRDRARRRARPLAADPQIARRSPAGSSGIGERLGYRVFLIALLAFTGAYAGLLALARARSPNAGRSCSIGALHADRVRRADPALDRRVQLHRLRAHGRGARRSTPTCTARSRSLTTPSTTTSARTGSTSPPPTARCTR